MDVKNKSFYPFLFAIYPLLSLYARLPDGLKASSLIRPTFFLLSTTLFLRWLYARKLKGIERGNLLTAFTILFFSSSGYVFRSVKELLWSDAPVEVHLFLALIGLFLIFGFFHPLLWEKYLTPPRLQSFSLYLNAVSVFAILVPLFTLGSSLYQATKHNDLSATELFGKIERTQSLENEMLPDIYYIILDAYARADVLQDVYHFDNQAFIEALEARDFYVANQSRSNYIWTTQSLTSSLNFNYLDGVAKRIGSQNAYSIPFYELNEHSNTRTFLEEMGYQTAVVASDYGYTDWRDAAYYLRPFTINPNPLEGAYLSMTFLGALYEIDHPWVMALRNFLPVPAYSTRRDHILYAFEAMDKLVAIQSPKFIFVHIVAPHPPFVIDKNGKQLKTNRPYGGLGGTSTTPEGYQHDYIGQLEYVNREILKAIDLILLSNDNAKVIILQGDHGGASLLSGDIEKSCLFERASILNAYYFSDGNTQSLYPSITPVNSFRVVFNKYFGTELPMLTDKTYFSSLDRPLEFVNIGDSIEKTCETDK